MHVALFQRPQVWYKFHRNRTTSIIVSEQNAFFLKNLPRVITQSYGPLAPIPVHMKHPVIVIVDTSFQLSSFHSSLEICCENFQA